jgi:hypothetical protein
VKKIADTANLRSVILERAHDVRAFEDDGQFALRIGTNGTNGKEQEAFFSERGISAEKESGLINRAVIRAAAG